MYNYKLSTSLFVLSLVLVGIMGCEKLEDLIKFKFQDTSTIVVPSQTFISTGLLNLPSPEVQTSSKQAFKNNNTEAKYVKDARLTELTLTITDPQDKTFSFLNEVKIYISAPDLEEVLIAYKKDIPASVGNKIHLNLSSPNLKPYISGDTYNIRTEAKVDELTSQDTHIRANMEFTVTADVL